MATVDTLKVHHLENLDEFMVINASDFDSRIHQHYSPKKKRSKPADPPADPTPNDQRSQREQDLYAAYDSDQLSWRDIAALADPLGIEKPEGGWRDAIPLIAAAEYPDATD